MKVGDRVELIEMPDDPNPIPVGTKGRIRSINKVDFGRGDNFIQIGVDWENGRTLMLSVPPDRVRVIE